MDTNYDLAKYSQVNVYSVSFNADNSLLFTGSFTSSTVDFNPYSGIDTINNSATNTYDVFVSRFEWANIVHYQLIHLIKMQ